MFDKNDKQLKIVRKITFICAIIFAVLGVIAGIILCATEDASGTNLIAGILLIVLVPFLSWLAWVYASLLLTFLCDVKLMRNKMYGLDNDNLSEFISSPSRAENYPSAQPAGAPSEQAPSSSASDSYEMLLRLKKLYDSGALSQEEYEQKKRELLDR